MSQSNEVLKHQIFYENGKPKLEWYTNNGQKFGKSRCWDENEEKPIELAHWSEYSGITIFHMEGPYKAWHENEQLAVETDYYNVRKNRKEGLEKIWNLDGTREEKNYDSSYYLTAHRMIDANGQLRTEVHYDRNELHGSYKTWYADGTPKEELEFNKGRHHGKDQKTWYENGQLATKYDYHNGSKIGSWESWHPNGVMSSSKLYSSNGMFREWNDAGTLTMQGVYDGDKKSGLYETWYANGQVKYQGEFNQNVPVGAHTDYYEDGTLKNEAHYNHDGQPHGKQSKYAKDGTATDIYYINGTQLQTEHISVLVEFLTNKKGFDVKPISKTSDFKPDGP
jgi:antitoxin component YwqK of YwqJK toxin-antitoxin module